MTLVEFLLARIAEDEVVARAAIIPAHPRHSHEELATWRYQEGGEVEYDWDDPNGPGGYLVTCDSEGILPAVEQDVGTFIARFDPARVLRECAAKRRIIEMQPEGLPGPLTGMWVAQQFALGAIASIYAGHPDYREEWRPSDSRVP